MSRIFWKNLALFPAILGANVLLSASVMAAENLDTAETEQPKLNQQLMAQAKTDENRVLVSEIENQNSMSQVTSVSQFSDVQPTDWAFQALQSLVERYGCIAGYPNGTYRGNRALTRYEFAAGLNACLRQIEKLIATPSAPIRLIQRMLIAVCIEVNNIS